MSGEAEIAEVVEAAATVEASVFETVVVEATEANKAVEFIVAAEVAKVAEATGAARAAEASEEVEEIGPEEEPVVTAERMVPLDM